MSYTDIEGVGLIHIYISMGLIHTHTYIHTYTHTHTHTHTHLNDVAPGVAREVRQVHCREPGRISPDHVDCASIVSAVGGCPRSTYYHISVGVVVHVTCA
jgi:hypothetical protein